MNEIGSAIVISAITASLLAVFLWLGEARMRWKVLALAAFALGIALQTFLGIALSVYFKAGL